MPITCDHCSITIDYRTKDPAKCAMGEEYCHWDYVSAHFFRFPHCWLSCVCAPLFGHAQHSGPRHIKTMHLIVYAALVGVRHGFLLDVVV
jgi:hypothetical protein